MKRILLVTLLAALLCIGITGLRVVLLQQMAVPATSPAAPQPIKERQPPRAERPIEYVAGAPLARPDLSAGTVLLWPRSTAPAGRGQPASD